MGLPGTGKTIIAQQYTFHNARPDRPVVIFLDLVEPLEKIVRFGQNLDSLRLRGRHVSVLMRIWGCGPTRMASRAWPITSRRC